MNEIIGTVLVLGCQRSDCDAIEQIDVGQIRPGTHAAFGLDEAISEGWPDGWGWDYEGVNSVLHCPEHRSS